MALYKIRQGTTRPLRATLKAAGKPFDLTHADTMTFAMRLVGAADTDPPAFSGAAEPEVGAEKRGRFVYPWDTGETDDPGMYDAMVRVVMDDGEIVDFPAEPSDFRVEITPSLLH